MVFVGPSGCGKSTLLRLISGLEDITSGDMLFDKVRVNELAPSKRGIAMVFQSYALYPHMKVYDNMAFGMKLQKAGADDIKERVMKAAKLLQIDHLLDRLPKQLSGGQRQRVAIGRAIVRDPRVFLFDEPLSNLDAALRVATRLEIAKLHHSMGNVTMVYVTHDQVEAMTLADRICVLRDGLVMQVGSPTELYEKPNSIFVAGFIGSPKMNFLNGGISKAYNCATLGIRSEHIVVDNDNPTWKGEVVHAENLGSDNYLFVDIGSDEPVLVRQEGKTSIPWGANIGIRPLEENLHRFDDKGAADTLSYGRVGESPTLRPALRHKRTCQRHAVPGGSETRPSLSMKGPSASRTACATACSPEFRIASAVGPAPTKARCAAPAVSKVIDNAISSSSMAVRPATRSASSSFPGSDRANMPLRFILSSASGGYSGNNGLNTKATPDSPALVGTTTATGPRETRRASARARALSSANWKALNPVTTSKDSSGHGSVSSSPTRKSPDGVRSAAIAMRPSAASMPATLAPRSAAMRAKRPAPHPQSSTRVPDPIFARSSTRS